MQIECHHLNDPAEFLNFWSSWNNDLSGYVFRGHSKENYVLVPSVLREDNRYLIDDQFPIITPEGQSKKSELEWFQIQIEYHLLRDFFKSSDRHGLKVPNSEYIRNNLVSKYDYTFTHQKDFTNNWIPSPLLEVAALAQHYGVPTRLLDWTYDPLVAAFFALSGVRDTDGNITIWCFNAERVSDTLAITSNSPLKIITPPYSDNANLSAQSGLFTSLSSSLDFSSPQAGAIKVDRRSLDKRLDEILPTQMQDRDKVLIKVTFPCSKAKEAYELLEKNGYGEARIYPGYSGIAKQVMRNHAR